MTDRRRLTISIPIDLFREIKAQSDKFHIPMNSVVLLRIQFKNPGSPFHD